MSYLDAGLEVNPIRSPFLEPELGGFRGSLMRGSAYDRAHWEGVTHSTLIDLIGTFQSKPSFNESHANASVTPTVKLRLEPTIKLPGILDKLASEITIAVSNEYSVKSVENSTPISESLLELGAAGNLHDLGYESTQINNATGICEDFCEATDINFLYNQVEGFMDCQIEGSNWVKLKGVINALKQSLKKPINYQDVFPYGWLKASPETKNRIKQAEELLREIYVVKNRIDEEVLESGDGLRALILRLQKFRRLVYGKDPGTIGKTYKRFIEFKNKQKKLKLN